MNSFKLSSPSIWIKGLGCFLFALGVLFYQRKPQPDLTVVGYISEADGLGRQSAEIIDCFQDKLNLNFVRTRREKGSKVPERFLPFLDEKRTKWGKVILFEDMLWRPGKDLYKKILPSNRENSLRIAYSVWESTEIPQKWVTVLNTHFDAVVVPCQFLKETYRDSGVTIPLFVLPLGLNLEPLLQQPLKQKPQKPFVFGNLSACSDRKNQLMLVRAFAKCFGNNPNVKLKINSRYGEEDVIEAIKAEIESRGLANIQFTQSALSKKEYLEIFKEIDCYVSPSKGEGFSIQPREALALGIPVIVTNNTGQQDLCDSGHVVSLPAIRAEPALFPWGETYGMNFTCDEEKLAMSLLTVYENYESCLCVSRKGREWVKQFLYHNLRDNYRALIAPTIMEFGKENIIENGKLYTNSEELFKKIQKLFSPKNLNGE